MNNSRNIMIVVLGLIIIAVLIGVLILGGSNDDSENTADTTTEETQQEESEQTDNGSTEQADEQENDATTEPAETAPTTNNPTENSDSEPTTTEEPTIIEQPTTIDDSQADPQPNTPTAPHAKATYTTYSPEKLAQARRAGKNIVLFFHATWCPTCRALDTEIKNGLNRIPDNTEILVIDYDGHPDLRREYNIQYQHSLVFMKGGSQEPYATLSGGGVDLNEVLFQLENLNYE